MDDAEIKNSTFKTTNLKELEIALPNVCLKLNSHF